jgi:hypothetical protein
MEVSGQLPSPAALPSGEELLMPIVAGWVSEPVLMLWRGHLLPQFHVLPATVPTGAVPRETNRCRIDYARCVRAWSDMLLSSLLYLTIDRPTLGRNVTFLRVCNEKLALSLRWTGNRPTVLPTSILTFQFWLRSVSNRHFTRKCTRASERI